MLPLELVSSDPPCDVHGPTRLHPWPGGTVVREEAEPLRDIDDLLEPDGHPWTPLAPLTSLPGLVLDVDLAPLDEPTWRRWICARERCD